MTQQPGKLIVLAAFDENEDGELIPAFDPREFNDAGRARREAQVLAGKHVGVIAWQRTADPQIGEYGEPEVLFQHGKIPEME